MRSLTLSLLLLVSLSSCLPTSIPYASTNIQQELAAIVMGECKKLGITPRVSFETENRTTSCLPYSGESGECTMAMASVLPDRIFIFPDALHYPHNWRAWAQHECCHLALKHRLTVERTEEAEAEACVAERF